MILLAIRGYIQLGKAANVKTRGAADVFQPPTKEGRAKRIPELIISY